MPGNLSDEAVDELAAFIHEKCITGYRGLRTSHAKLLEAIRDCHGPNSSITNVIVLGRAMAVLGYEIAYFRKRHLRIRGWRGIQLGSDDAI